MRGWSLKVRFIQQSYRVIPANAGVILIFSENEMQKIRYPRECGGDPAQGLFFTYFLTLSPRMRGWSLSGKIVDRDDEVIPANAGVILDFWTVQCDLYCYPRECGGDPGNIAPRFYIKKLSPRMRGWSSEIKILEWINLVIPANAGVILNFLNS